MMCRGIVVYILNVNLTWFNNPIHGISSPNKCIVGLGSITKNNYKTWSAKIWDLTLHELGHSFGLVRKNRAHSAIGILGTKQGANHCLNNCVMSEDKFDFIWIRKASRRFDSHIPYCEDCLKYLLAKDV
jgi:predicted Zn-dependent protease